MQSALHLLHHPAAAAAVVDDVMIACEDCSAAGPDLFAKLGVFCVRDAVPPSTLTEVQRAAKANLEEVLQYRSQRYAAGTAGDGVWKELCNRDGDRFDVHFRMMEEPFATLGREGSWCTAVRQILGTDAKLLYVGQVVACGCDPDAESDEDEPEDQAWHMDGDHLDDEIDLPCHILTVFVPLVNLSAENGATEFSLGSHLHACDSPMGERVIECPAGSAIIFDYRLLHRGTANQTTADRPILYFTYSRSWFEDPVNYRHENQDKSILDGLSEVDNSRLL
jgi:ectoine hydroxylase-related dioxygenase (phytanoyl-CoA dioxygenase family)